MHIRDLTKVFLVLAVLVGSSGAVSADSRGAIAGQAVIKTVGEVDLESLLEQVEGTPADSIFERLNFLITFPDSTPVQVVVDALSNSPNVEWAHANYELILPEVNQISQSFGDQAHPDYIADISPTSFYSQPSVSRTDLDEAHTLTKGGGATVAIIDNGIDPAHPLISSSTVLSGYDYVDDDEDPSEEAGDLLGHGTFVAGLVLLAAPNAQLLPLRTFDETGKGNTFSVTKAIYDAIDQDAQVINMSFSVDSSSSALEEAVAAANDSGVVLVASAGNDSTSAPRYPAAYSSVLAVSALDTLEYLADFSNYGSHIDVCAHGVSVYSALSGTYEWGTWTGTSFAAPVVSGVAALLKTSYPGVTPDQVLQTLRLTASPNLAWGTLPSPDSLYGHGLVNAYSTVRSWMIGNVNMSGGIDIADITYLVSYMFEEGPEPLPDLSSANFNCDNSLDIHDLVVLVKFMFDGGTDYRPCPDPSL